MTVIKYHLMIICAAFMLGGCNKYLEIEPEGSYTADQVFSNEPAIQQSLNGLYLELADNALYGADLSSTTVELLGQRYLTRTGGASDHYLFQQYQYSDDTVKSKFDAIWKKAYGTILSANVFLSKIDPAIRQHIISEVNGQQLKGEAVAVRALLHFDMLRLFGPVYSAGADQLAIPYYTMTDGKSQPILAASAVMDNVIADLKQAAILLGNDPIKNGLGLSGSDFYAGKRNQRLNYYAVEGLLARAYLWAGKKTEANQAAQEALANAEQLFSWLPYGSILSNANPDRIFSTELLFGLYNRSLYENYTVYFSSDLIDGVVLRAEPNRLKTVFENNENDYRYTTTWFNTTKNYPTFFKFADLGDVSKPWRFLQPILRKTELYYILAETDPDPGNALSYLNQVRYHRGLTDLPPGADIALEITKEYQREFWGEGQSFFYYKRQNSSTIPSALNGTSTVQPVYVVPLPLSETTPR